MKILGPYIFNSGANKGRKFIVIKTKKIKRTILYSRYIMESFLGRQLTSLECVDHINEDKTDDRLENLQILTRSENSIKAKADERRTMFIFTCPVCNKLSEKPLNYVKNNLKRHSGPFCSRSCAGKFTRI